MQILTHKALPVGKWLQQRGKHGGYKSCNYDFRIDWTWLVVLHVHKYDLGNIYMHFGGMRHGRLEFIWLCYMVVFAKNAWMRGAQDSSLALIVHITHWTWTTIECTQIWGSRNLQKACSTVASIDMWNVWKYRYLKWYSWETHTIANAKTVIWTDLVVSLHAQFKNLQGDSESQKLARTQFISL